MVRVRYGNSEKAHGSCTNVAQRRAYAQILPASRGRCSERVLRVEKEQIRLANPKPTFDHQVDPKKGEWAVNVYKLVCNVKQP